MNKVILITGASSGIGRQSAKLLVQQGHIVYGAARRVDKMQDLKEAGIRLLQMDVTDEASTTKGIREIMDTEKRIDVLVNNAGYGSYGSVEDVPLSEAKYQFDVNVFGLARLSQAVLPYMRAQKSGLIINISSMAGKFGEPHGGWYHASKYAVEGLSDCMRMELKPFGIDVVIIEPGAIKTEWNKIAEDNLAKMSMDTAYRDSANSQIKRFESMYRHGSEPIVIAKAIAKAIGSKHPKTRYVAGKGARAILWTKKILPDKLFDKIVLKVMG